MKKNFSTASRFASAESVLKNRLLFVPSTYTIPVGA